MGRGQAFTAKVAVPGVTHPNKEPDCQGATRVASRQ